MSPERFEALAGAFGGDLGRWPAAERQAALRLAAVRTAWTAPVLGGASRLDGFLDAAPSWAPSRELRERIVQAAPLSRTSSRAWRWLVPLGLAAGLAGSAVAGVAAGVIVAPAALLPLHVEAAADPGEEAAALLREPSDFGEG
ncbi:MAG: hypothetical protein ACR2F8_06085 [Caulobacteraceae bacterium]